MFANTQNTKKWKLIQNIQNEKKTYLAINKAITKIEMALIYFTWKKEKNPLKFNISSEKI